MQARRLMVLLPYRSTLLIQKVIFHRKLSIDSIKEQKKGESEEKEEKKLPDRLPRGFWKEKKNHRVVLDSVMKNLGLESPKEFIDVSKHKVLKHGARSLFSHYSSFYDALRTIYPEEEWDLFDFKPIPKNEWKKINVQREWLDRFARKHNVATLEDWKQVKVRDIHDNGGYSILGLYPSVFTMLATVYPEYPWNALEDRKVVPRNHWEHTKHIEEFLERMKEKYKIKKHEDWSRIANFQLHESGGGGLLRKFGSLEGILHHVYPHVDWKPYELSSKKKRAAQRFLFLQVKKIFETEEVIEDFYHVEVSRMSGMPSQFDIFIPSLSIAIEYQGEHHYQEIPAFGPLELYKQRDEEKKKLCSTYKIHLARIPFWIGSDEDQLQKELREQLPCFLHEYLTKEKRKE